MNNNKQTENMALRSLQVEQEQHQQPPIHIEYLNFDMFFRTYKDQFQKQADSLVLFVHWFLVQNRYKCLVDGIVSN